MLRAIRHESAQVKDANSLKNPSARKWRYSYLNRIMNKGQF